MSIATIILDQLGGPGFIMMTGAKNFVSDGNTLRMTLPRNASGANRLYIADLPILPQQWQYLVSTSTKKQFSILQKLMNRPDVDSIVCATDAG